MATVISVAGISDYGTDPITLSIELLMVNVIRTKRFMFSVALRPQRP